MLRCLAPQQVPLPAPGASRRLVAKTGYFRLRTWAASLGSPVPDAGLYQPLYSPWLGDEEFERVYAHAEGRTLVSRDRCYVLWRTLRQSLALDGELIECGVFRGGTALLEAAVALEAGGRPLHLVDSFEGMPVTTEDVNRFTAGDFGATSLEEIRTALEPYPFARIHKGFIPEIFGELGVERLAWAHIDVNIYTAVRDCLDFVYPRLVPGGTVVIDDYGFPSCVGARRAVNEHFADGRPGGAALPPDGPMPHRQGPVAGRYSNGNSGAISRRSGASASRAETCTSTSGQRMPTSGSSHRKPRSTAGS